MNVCGTLKSFGPCVPLNSSGPCTYKLDGGGRGTDSFGHVSHSTQVALVHTNLTVVVEEQTVLGTCPTQLKWPLYIQT